MAMIVEYPQVVQQALKDFEDVFDNQAQRRHFADYLTGLFVAEQKTVLGITNLFAQGTDQSCLNKFLNYVDWDVALLNERRLSKLQEDASTRYHPRGVIAIDNTLIDHFGELILDVGWYWDHSEERYKIAHDYLFINYVCPSGKHYPVEFRRFRKEQQALDLEVPFKNHTTLCCELIDFVCERQIPGAFTMDSYFTNAEILNHIHNKRLNGQPRAYVGDLKMNRKLHYRGRTLKANELAQEIASSKRKKVTRSGRTQWYFTCTLRIPQVGHKVRIVMLWNHADVEQPCKMLVTNQVRWEVRRILSVYRYRWTGTETFHRDGKQALGMGDCRLRYLDGQDRHMYLVMLAYSLLMQQLQTGHAHEWACQWLTTIGQACRAIRCETLRATLRWAIEQVSVHAKTIEHVFDVLKLQGECNMAAA
jgi:hypothetical protein